MATTLLRPDQTFYPSPRLAAKAPVETLAYMVTFDPTRKKPDGLVTLDVDPKSRGFGKEVGRAEVPNVGDEFHHCGGNVCSWPMTFGGISATTLQSPVSGELPTWSRPGSIPSSYWQASTVISSTSGICRSDAIARRSTSARSSRWCSSFVPLTIRARHTDSS